MADLSTGSAFGLGALTALLVLFAVSLSVLVRYISRDTEAFRRWLENQ